MVRIGRTAAVALAVIALSATAACSSSKSKSTSSPTSGSTGGSASGGSASAKTAKVLVLYPYLGDQSYVRERSASVAEVKKVSGVTVDVKAGPSRTSVDFFLSQINNAKTEGYGVIAINTGGTAAQLVPALNKATAAGIKVVSFDGAPPVIKSLSSTVNYNNFAASEVAGAKFKALLPNGGNIGVIRCLAGLPDTDAFVNGFMAAIKGSNLKVVATGDAKCDPDQSRTIAENMLTAHKDLVGIYDSVDVSAQGSLKAITAAKSKAILGSIGGQQYALQDIAGGNATWKFTVPYPFEKIGSTAVDTAVTLAKGGTVPAKVVIPAQPVVTSANAATVLAQVNKSIKDGGQ